MCTAIQTCKTLLIPGKGRVHNIQPIHEHACNIDRRSYHTRKNTNNVEQHNSTNICFIDTATTTICLITSLRYKDILPSIHTSTVCSRQHIHIYTHHMPPTYATTNVDSEKTNESFSVCTH